MSFAIIDFETTGLMPERGDRVVEIGVVLADGLGSVEDEWTTLVNPGRDIGASHIHGLRTVDLMDAPTFDEVADHLLGLMGTRTVVAHNAAFDMRFLQAELLRTGYATPQRPPALCSMKWAGRVIGAAKLQHCCEALGIRLDDAHTALADARATAQLVAHLAPLVGEHHEWQDDLAACARFAWPSVTPADAPRVLRRGQVSVDEYAWLRSVLQAAWIPGAPEDEAIYLIALDRALLDRAISHTEGRELLATAEAAGLTRETVGRLHHDYLRSVAQEALADGVVTSEERQDLEAIASALGLGAPYVDEALNWALDHAPSGDARSFILEPGDRVVFTGEMKRGRDEWVAEIAAARLASGGVTKSTKLVVAADPDSMSGKAAKARKYGVPVVGEEAFERFFADYCARVAA